MSEWDDDEEITTTLGTIELVRRESHEYMRRKIMRWMQFHVCTTCEGGEIIHPSCDALMEDILLIKEMPEEW